MTQDDKEGIRTATFKLIEQRGVTDSKYARQAGVSPAIISHLKSGNWDLFSENMWQKLIVACNYLDGWTTADTVNFKKIQKYCSLAQDRSMSMAISYAAGSGKTEAYKYYSVANKNVIYVECADHFTRNLFMDHFLRSIGQNPNGLKVVEKAEKVITSLKGMNRPVVILDEMDKLKPGPFMFFIELYNKLDGHCGFLLSGAPYFRLHVEKFAAKDKKGYREFYSRIGRKFIALNKISEEDVRKVCAANGVTEPQHATSIYHDCEGDLRRVKRDVEKLKLQQNKMHAA